MPIQYILKQKQDSKQCILWRGRWLQQPSSSVTKQSFKSTKKLPVTKIDDFWSAIWWVFLLGPLSLFTVAETFGTICAAKLWTKTWNIVWIVLLTSTRVWGFQFLSDYYVPNPFLRRSISHLPELNPVHSKWTFDLLWCFVRWDGVDKPWKHLQQLWICCRQYQQATTVLLISFMGHMKKLHVEANDKEQEEGEAYR